MATKLYQCVQVTYKDVYADTEEDAKRYFAQARVKSRDTSIIDVKEVKR